MTWTDELPIEDFALDVILCIVSEDDEDGGAEPQMRYEARGPDGTVVAQTHFPVPTTIFRHGNWPATAPVRCWPVLRAHFPVAKPGYYEMAFSLDDHPPVIV